MAQPTPYERQFAFSGQPKATWAEGLENELNAVKVTSDETLNNLELIQRDDGALRNGIVTKDSLAPDLALAGLVALDFASQSEAEAGSNNTKTMTPLRSKQQTDARLADQATAEAGADNVDLMTSLRTKQSIDENALTPLGESTTATWPHAGNIYGPTDGAIDASTVRISNSAGTHDRSRILDHMEMHVDGCGFESAPDKADHVVSRAIFKNNYPSISALPGEIDVSIHAYRQVNGDASCHLGNGVIINGFACYQEANIYCLDPGTLEYAHSVNMQDAVVNDRDNDFYGSVRQKTYGVGGKGLLVTSAGSAAWKYGVELSHQGKVQFQQRVEDAIVLIYAFNNPDDSTLVEQIAGGLRLRDPDGAVYNDLKSKPTSYTANVAVDSGTIAATTNACFYVRRGKQYEIFFDYTIDEYTGTPTVIIFDIPSGVTPRNIAFGGTGTNMSNGQALSVFYAGGKIRVLQYNGVWPVASGHRVAGSITLMTD